MNITSGSELAIAPPPSNASDLARGIVANTPADPSATPGANDPGFGQVLDSRLAALAKGDARESSVRDAAPDAVASDGSLASLIAAATAQGAVDAKGDEPKTEAKSDAKADADAVGIDLAAQMALASQWKDPSMPAAPSSPNTAAEAQGVRGIRVGNTRGSLDGTVLDARPASKADAGNEKAPSEGVAAPGPATHGASIAAAIVDGLAAQGGHARDAIVTSQPASIAPLPDLVAGARVTDANTASAASAAQTVTEALQQRVGTPAWSQEVGHAVLRMAANELQSASLSLNPDQLGPLDVRIRVEHGTAHLAFNAAHADTRQAIEASRATLEQMFSQQGLAIGDCSVGDAPSRRFAFDADASSQGTRNGFGERGRNAGSDEPATTEPLVRLRVTSALGRVDTFA